MSRDSNMYGARDSTDTPSSWRPLHPTSHALPGVKPSRPRCYTASTVSAHAIAAPKRRAAKPDPLRLKRLGQWKNRPTVTLVTDRDLGHTGRDLGHIGGRDIAHTGGRDIAHCGRDLGHAEHMLTPEKGWRYVGAEEAHKVLARYGPSRVRYCAMVRGIFYACPVRCYGPRHLVRKRGTDAGYAATKYTEETLSKQLGREVRSQVYRCNSPDRATPARITQPLRLAY
eukprot:1709477-Rhodomonas_salina.3